MNSKETHELVDMLWKKTEEDIELDLDSWSNFDAERLVNIGKMLLREKKDKAETEKAERKI